MQEKCLNKLYFSKLSLHAVLLSFMPERWLYAKTIHAMDDFLTIEEAQYKLCFTASGRAALTMLFKYLRNRSDKPVDTILIPDYICNVVSLAAEYAGLRVRFYRTCNYAPCMESVEETLDKYEHTCVLFASLMGHCCEHKALYTTIRSHRPDVPIIFDECQNLPGIRSALPTLSQEDVYCVISFNNKMTQGLLGGAVYGVPQENWEFEPQTHAERNCMQLNLTISYLKQNIKLLREYCTGHYHTPDEEEKSSCEGKYCVIPYRVYKISLAAAYLGLHDWVSFEKALVENGHSLLHENSAIRRVSQCNTPIPLYVPIAQNSNLIGRYPLKGRYWTSVPCPQYREHIYLVVHNTLKACDPQLNHKNR